MKKLVMVTMVLMFCIGATDLFGQSRIICTNCRGVGRTETRTYGGGNDRIITRTCTVCGGTGWLASSTPPTITRAQLDQYMQNAEFMQGLRDNPQLQEAYMGMLTPELQRVLRERLAATANATPAAPSASVPSQPEAPLISVGTTRIENRAFYSKGLNSITIPDSVTYIGESSLSYNQFSSITIPDSVTFIGDSAFFNNQLTSVTIPNSVTSIGIGAFAGNRLTSVTIPNRITSISGSVFNVNRLTNVTIPNSVTSIGGNAFANNPLNNITIGANVNVSSSAFPYGFAAFYDNNGKKAGTYVYADGAWSMR